MEHSDAEIPAKRPKLSDGGGGGGGEDRLSALPDDVLIHILLKLLDTAVAARTSVLSKRWPRLWKLLPQLWFRSSTAPLGIRSALESHQAPALKGFAVNLLDASPGSVEAWLPIAARRLSGNLYIFNKARQNEMEDDAAESGAVELPCFENATTISLELEYLGLVVPPFGIFARLTDLFLGCIELHGPCMLGEAVSSPRCPVLRKLTVHHVWGLDYFAIYSDSLLKIVIKHTHDLQQLTVTAPALKLLNVISCFAEGSSDNQPVAYISAPQLVSLIWIDNYDPRFTQFAEMKNLKWLTAIFFFVYGEVVSNYRLHNSNCMEILRRWRCIENLRIGLFFGSKDITNWEYLMEDITMFPKVINLTLDIRAKGHSCGPCLYHVFRVCTGVGKLYLNLVDESSSTEAQTGCPSGCVCDQPPNWKIDEFALNFLQEIKIMNLRGTGHEAGLVKRLFVWATVLETMTVTFDCSVAEGQAREFCQMLQSFSRPEICLKGPYFL